MTFSSILVRRSRFAVLAVLGPQTSESVILSLTGVSGNLDLDPTAVESSAARASPAGRLSRVSGNVIATNRIDWLE